MERMMDMMVEKSEPGPCMKLQLTVRYLVKPSWMAVGVARMWMSETGAALPEGAVDRNMRILITSFHTVSLCFLVFA